MTKNLLTQNSELRKDGVWNWTLPAWVVRDSKGRAHNVCRAAGACVNVCYARNGTYNFPAVKAAHVRNLEMVVDDLGGWAEAMLSELGRPKFRPTGVPRLPELPRDHLSYEISQLLDSGCAAVRIHDAGDFLSDEYLLAWLAVAQWTPDVFFYCYTKEVKRFKAMVEGAAPPNFLWCYSMGGKYDALIDRGRDYHADVFPDEKAIHDAGYFSQDANDLLCVLAPSNRIGIPANNIAHFRKRQGNLTFSQMQQRERPEAMPA